MNTETTHRMNWYGIASDGNGGQISIPRTSEMNAREWGWDVTCTCGWQSRTGGATQASVNRAIAGHKNSFALCAEFGHSVNVLNNKCDDCYQIIS